jgi:hypothetical protein
MREPVNHLDAFLRTDPLDAACGRTIELLHIYVELTLAGADPGERFPGVAVHLRVCGPCAEDYATLLAAMRGE